MIWNHGLNKCSHIVIKRHVLAKNFITNRLIIKTYNKKNIYIIYNKLLKNLSSEKPKSDIEKNTMKTQTSADSNPSSNDNQSNENFNKDEFDKPQQKIRQNMPKIGQFITLLLGIGVVGYLQSMSKNQNKNEISWNIFVDEYIKKGQKLTLIVNNPSGKCLAIFNDLPTSRMKEILSINTGSINGFFEKIFQLTENKLDLLKNLSFVYSEGNLPTSVSVILTYFYYSVLIMAGILSFMFFPRTKSAFRLQDIIGKVGEAPLFNPTKTNIKFSDVLGCEEAKIEVKEFSEFLTNNERFKKMGAKTPKGAILYGPPGTGKTLLAKALANECGVKLYQTTGSDFVQSLVGMGAYYIRSLFEVAKKNAPCIVFIDEIDSIATSREGKSLAGHRENDSTVNQILVEMDGFTTDNRIIVIAATNRLDSIDKALLRPGRFDRHINVSQPDKKGREELFEFYLKKIKLLYENDKIKQLASNLADITAGFSGADISNICNEAAMLAVRENMKYVEYRHFNNAIDRVVAGSSNLKKYSPEEKHVIAVHESGHAVACYFGTDPMKIGKISIIPRGKALGYNLFIPKDQYMMTRRQIIAQMVSLLGGRVCEEKFIGKITTGAMDDLQRVTRLAYSYIGVYGMDNTFMKNLCYPSLENQLTPDIGHGHIFDEEFANKLDLRVLNLIKEAYEITKKIICDNEVKYLELVKQLELRESLNQEEIVEILGK